MATDGGSAFPIVKYNEKYNRQEWQPGMSLRDWFAGQALGGQMANPTLYGPDKDFAQVSYDLADAMIAEREKGGEG